MPIKIDTALTPRQLMPKIGSLFELSAAKILSLEKTWKPANGTPVFTVKGKYSSRGWTEWTQGFQFGSALLQFDATGDKQFLELGRRKTIESMAPHLTHMGVHDHGFNNISTYGNLWRLMREDKIPLDVHEKSFYELALKVSGAVQAARWTKMAAGGGFIYSFNGPHSLFIDTLRSLRSLAVAHQLDHVLLGERDQRISLLERLVKHGVSSAAFSVYYGTGRDSYDVAGRVAHESIFNTNDGSYRCPNSQQGYSPFSTWTRGLAWAVLGFAEQLEFLGSLPQQEVARSLPVEDLAKLLQSCGSPTPNGNTPVNDLFLKAAIVTAEFYITKSCADGIPVWDTGAPNLQRLGEYLRRPADPFNAWEPMDSSAAAIAAQGLIRLGNYLRAEKQKDGVRYRQAGFTIANALFDEPYLSTRPQHQGLLLHSIYHRPNGWDYVAPGQKIPNGESSMWGDYHARELGLLIAREARNEPYPVFFNLPNPAPRTNSK